jgi:t-SNARE complex subunit (syntaxin)
MMMQEQDRTMDTIAGTLSTLAQQAGLMGQEIAEHNEMLDDLEQGVDKTDNKLSDAMRRMRKFVRQTEETKSGWCVVILTIILIILLLAVILV